MTAHPESANEQTVKPIHHLFRNGVTAFWATTYSLDLHLFNEYLLPRLGDPPLNVVVLADHHRLSTVLQRIPIEQADALVAVNRRWLLRGISPGGGAFHPKTYLSVHSGGAVLLVGSGNLSIGGLSDGREVFSIFRSGSAHDDLVIRAWVSWMRQLVEFTDDTTVADRFRDLEARLGVADWPADGATENSLLHNLKRPIADQFVDRVHKGKGVDELLLAAPFFDADAAAAGRLLELLNPQRVTLFITKSTNVNGERLKERLDSLSADIRIAAYEPDQFVHAKLVGAISEGRGWLMSGSPNLSRAALTQSADQGNVELAIVSEHVPDELREVFHPPETAVVTRDMDDLVSLTFSTVEETPAPPVHFLRATLTDSGVEVTTAQEYEHEWLLDDLQSTHQLVRGNERGTAYTTEPIDGRLVQIVGPSGAILSNRVVIDDPAGLARVLYGGDARSDRAIPVEFSTSDTNTPLGSAIAWLHRNMVMDISENSGSTSTASGDFAVGDPTEDDDLWERLEKEKLGRDPRAAIYARLRRNRSSNADEPLIELLEAFGARAPTQQLGQGGAKSVLGKILRITPAPESAPPPDSPAGDACKKPRRWGEATRIRVRARNVLRRWADAQTDPRLLWIDPLAPAGNFRMITAALAFLHFKSAADPTLVELTADDLDELWLRWLRSFAGTGTGDGWLDRLDPPAYDKVREDTVADLAEAATALCWLKIRSGPSNRRERMISSQGVIAAALAHGLLDPTATTAQFLTEVTGAPVTQKQIDQELMAAIDYIDDGQWCKRQAEELGLSSVRLQPSPGSSQIKLRIDVAGIDDPLIDPRTPRLGVAARHYRKCEGVAIYSTDRNWRVILQSDGSIDYLSAKGEELLTTPAEVSSQDLEALAARSGVLADLFPSAAATDEKPMSQKKNDLDN